MSLIQIRQKIDRVDDELISLLLERLDLVYTLKDSKTTLTDSAREEAILSKCDSPYVQEIFKAIFKASKTMLQDKGFTYDS